MKPEPSRLEDAFTRFDAANAQDPRLDDDHGQPVPRELLYGHRMTGMLGRFAPDAPETVRLACRAQHIERWKSPRSDFPMDAEGYKQWRTRLYRFHADRAGELMKQAGYDDDMIEAVKKIVGKRGLKVNPETQMMEDVANLVFIEYYILEFANQKPDYTEEKWLGIIRKTWQKMSAAGRAFALSGGIALPEPLVQLITRAVADS